MIVGISLIARGFTAHATALADTSVCAAGISNSSCTDPRKFEAANDHAAKLDIIERGAGYVIDTARIQPALQRCRLDFGGDYVRRTISKYFRAHASRAT